MRVSFLCLLLLTIISFSLRFISLKTIPEGFHKDEASVGYNAYSIAKTAHDEFGHNLPFLFEALEDYKLPVVIYTAVPIVAIFGLNDFSVRFPTAFFGALTPVVLYFLIKNVTNNPRIAFLGGIILAISPQNILFSRSVNEGTISVFTIVTGVYFLHNLINKFTLLNLFLSSLFFIISIITYRTQFIFAPLILLTFIIIHYKTWKKWAISQKRMALMAIIIFIASLAFTVYKASNTRIKDIGLYTSIDVKQDIMMQIVEDGEQDPFVTHIYHNKLVNFFIAYTRNYFSHFDFSYLFFTGDKLSGINSTPWMGHLLLINLPFFLLGMFILIRNKTQSITLYWLFIGPIASAGTVDTPSALRNLVSTVAYSIIIAYGLNKLFEIKIIKIRNILLLGVVILYTFNLIYFWHLFTVHKKVHEPWGRYYGVERMVDILQSQQNNFEKVVFVPQDDFYIFLLYYQSINPLLVQNKQFKDRDNEIISLINPKYSFYKYTTTQIDCPKTGEANILYVCHGSRVPARGKILKSVRYADGLPNYTFIKFDPGYNSLLSKEKLPPRYEYLDEDLAEFNHLTTD